MRRHEELSAFRAMDEVDEKPDEIGMKGRENLVDHEQSPFLERREQGNRDEEEFLRSQALVIAEIKPNRTVLPLV